MDAEGSRGDTFFELRDKSDADISFYTRFEVDETGSSFSSGVFRNMTRKRPVLTMEQTPMLMKHEPKFRKENHLTAEEREQEYIKRIKETMAKKKLKAAKERKKSIDAENLPAKQKAVNKPIGFSFATDGRVKEIDLKSEPEVFDFVKCLRRPEASNFNPSRTKPEPFVFHGKEVKPREKVETFAEKCVKFTNKTPARFRTRSRRENKRTANFMNATVSHDGSDGSHFHAKPLNPKILDGPVGLKPRKQIPITVPHSPAFSRLHASKKAESKDEESFCTGALKICPLPSSSAPFKPQLEHRKVELEPFSFESRDKEMMLKKEENIKKVLEAEKEAREFHARPLPSFNEVSLPAKKKRPVTQPDGFDLEIEKRVALQHEKWQKKLTEERMQEKENAKFKARRATVLEMEPFVPEKPSLKGHNISIMEKDMHLPIHTEKRAEAWKDMEKYQQERQAELEEIAVQRELERIEEEEEEVRRIREQAVHKAQPIKAFKPVTVEQSKKPLTNPQTPNFSRRLTEKYANKP